MKVMTVVGTRPELIRLSLVFKSFEEVGVEHVLVHTGQNFDPRLSDVFFGELGLPADQHLGIRAERVGDQIGQIIAGQRAGRCWITGPTRLLVLGDTNSGLSAIGATRIQHPGVPHGGGEPVLRLAGTRGEEPPPHRPHLGLVAPIHGAPVSIC